MLCPRLVSDSRGPSRFVRPEKISTKVDARYLIFFLSFSMEQFVQLVDSMPNPVWLNSGAGAKRKMSSTFKVLYWGRFSVYIFTWLAVEQKPPKLGETFCRRCGKSRRYLSDAGASAGDSSIDNRCHSGFDNLADIHPQLSALEVRGRSL